jgi:hypothetical protein
MIILDQEGLAKALGQHSGNPFLDAMVDMQDLFTTISAYQQHKPYIDKYSDTSLSDLKDKVKAYLPEAIDKDGNINFSKLEELASNGNPLAEHILTIKQHREQFANAPIIGKLEAIKNDAVRDILSGNKLTKEANILKKSQQFDEILKKANIPEERKTLLSLNKEAFLSDPKLLAYLTTIFSNQQPTQNNQQDTEQQSDNIFNLPAMQSIQSIFDAKTKDILQSLIPKPSSTNTTEKKKQTVKKVKQTTETKKNQNKQSQQQTNSNSGIIFPWQSTSLPILPYEILPPKITTLW